MSSHLKFSRDRTIYFWDHATYRKFYANLSIHQSIIYIQQKHWSKLFLLYEIMNNPHKDNTKRKLKPNLIISKNADNNTKSVSENMYKVRAVWLRKVLPTFTLLDKNSAWTRPGLKNMFKPKFLTRFNTWAELIFTISFKLWIKATLTYHHCKNNYHQNKHQSQTMLQESATKLINSNTAKNQKATIG